MATVTNITQDEFIKREARAWGIDQVESLLERGYEPVLTTRGWTWILPKNEQLDRTRYRVAA